MKQQREDANMNVSLIVDICQNLETGLYAESRKAYLKKENKYDPLYELT